MLALARTSSLFRASQLPGNPHRNNRIDASARVTELAIGIDQNKFTAALQKSYFFLVVPSSSWYGSCVLAVVHRSQVKNISPERKASKCAFAQCEGGRVRVL